jgi:threonyl-tRNA synthetase
LKSAGLRVQIDDRNEKVGFKIREGETQKIPYMLIIGDKEINDNVIAVRRRREGDIGQMSLDEFISMIQKEIDEKSLLT